MSTDNLPRVEGCTCLAVRQAARRITQFYDQHLSAVLAAHHPVLDFGEAEAAGAGTRRSTRWPMSL